MKYSVPYYKNFRHFDTVDEIILQYSKHNNNITEFVKKHYKDEQKIVVDITRILEEIEQTIPVLQNLIKVHSNTVIKTSIIDYEILKENNIPYFFVEFCENLDEVYAHIHAGASEVYVVSGLGFQITEVAEYCHNNNVLIRVIPNMAQHSYGMGDLVPSITKFFIRPEDIHYYEPYVDICELMIAGDRLSVLYEIYKNEEWLGDLNLIIAGVDEGIPNKGILTDFGNARLQCRHKCMLRKCHLCEQCEHLTKILVFGEAAQELNVSVKDVAKALEQFGDVLQKTEGTKEE